MTSAHPAVLASLLALLVNDHVLKHAWPGAVTGKVSDFAGPVVLAAVLGDLLRRREAWAWWAVGIGFASVKTWAAFVPAALHLSVARDPWDLAGLVALPVAWRLTRRRVVLPRAVRFAACGAALLATAATSVAQHPAADVLVVGKGRVVTYVGRRAYASTDRGLTWDDAGDAPPQRAAVDPANVVGRTACNTFQHCYRIAGRDEIEESADSGFSWHRSWRTPAALLRGRRARTPGLVPFTHEDDFGQSGAKDVAFVPGSDVVLVAYGREGVLRRDGAGPWTRVGVGRAVPPRPVRSLFDKLRLFGFWTLIALLLAAFVLGVVAWRGRRVHPA